MTEIAPKRIALDPNAAFLCAIYQMLEEHGIPPTRMQVYARVGVSYQATNQRLHILEGEKLVAVSADHRVRLTPEGARRAAVVVRKHRLSERLLVDIVGLEWEFAHEEASRWQHVLGDEVERKLVGLLPQPWLSPFGNAIPAIEDLNGTRPIPSGRDNGRRGRVVVRCDYFAHQGGGSARLHSIGEKAQTRQVLLRRLREARIVPDTELHVSKQSKQRRIVLKRANTQLTITSEDAPSIFVSVDVVVS